MKAPSKLREYVNLQRRMMLERNALILEEVIAHRCGFGGYRADPRKLLILEKKLEQVYNG